MKHINNTYDNNYNNDNNKLYNNIKNIDVNVIEDVLNAIQDKRIDILEVVNVINNKNLDGINKKIILIIKIYTLHNKKN